ncbi:hypothetical protein BX661DRAFT_223151 [Kickxella alabastrina]|uniref:uncharacterized protein n=1 Tax=Kickxella alabastrina TaxID=61397 RepID=UPI0022201E34|nr:uncharacterized protein BX661DRAFT_223151 [Kickxella alabastrina]KAI7832993.1 hypothetical protein BX661DRAFT_223151 [Kickxella alabastrina]
MSTLPNGPQLPLIVVEEIVRYCLDMHTATNHRGDDASSAEDPSTLESNDEDSSSNSNSEFSDVSSSDDADDMASAIPLLAFDDWNSVFQSKMCKQIMLLFARILEFSASLPVDTMRISVEHALPSNSSVIFGEAHMLQLHIDNPVPDLGARHAGNMDIANVAGFMARVKEMVLAIQRIDIWWCNATYKQPDQGIAGLLSDTTVVLVHGIGQLSFKEYGKSNTNLIGKF